MATKYYDAKLMLKTVDVTAHVGASLLPSGEPAPEGILLVAEGESPDNLSHLKPW